MLAKYIKNQASNLGRWLPSSGTIQLASVQSGQLRTHATYEGPFALAQADSGPQVVDYQLPGGSTVRRLVNVISTNIYIPDSSFLSGVSLPSTTKAIFPGAPAAGVTVERIAYDYVYNSVVLFIRHQQLVQAN